MVAVLPTSSGEIPPLEFLESLQLGGDQYVPGTRLLRDERAVGAADRLAEHARRLIANRDRDARKHGALGVDHAPAELGRALLRSRTGGGEQGRRDPTHNTCFIHVLPDAYFDRHRYDREGPGHIGPITHPECDGSIEIEGPLPFFGFARCTTGAGRKVFERNADAIELDGDLFSKRGAGATGVRVRRILIRAARPS